MALTATKLMTPGFVARTPSQQSDASQMATIPYKFGRSLSSNVTCNRAKASKALDHLETVREMSREGTPYDPSAIVRVLIPISIAGWLLFGVICILCINGRGKAGRWIPEWYLDSQGTRRDKAMVVLWWVTVMVLWPLILPVLLARKVVQVVKWWAAKGKKEAQLLWPRKSSMEEV